MTPPALAIRSIGAVTAGGPTAAMSMGAIHAQLQLFEDTAVVGPSGDAITGALTPLDKKHQGVARVAGLGLLALSECAAAAGAAAAGPQPVIVCGPALADLEATEAELLDRLSVDGGIPIDRARSRVIPRGRASVIEALGIAADLLRSGAVAGCYLVGVDSLVTPTRLQKLVEQQRVLDGVNPDGFVPGEAAAALLLLATTDPQTKAVIAGVGAADDSGVAGGHAGTGGGIGVAIERAAVAAGVQANRIAAIAHDLSGSYALSDELALAAARPPFTAMTSVRMLQIPFTTGETGAASGVLALAALAFFLENNAVTSPAAALFTSDGASRGAAVVVREPVNARGRRV
jgi:3-oxoacyl-[acyl-carrier-protein] synthase-1